MATHYVGIMTICLAALHSMAVYATAQPSKEFLGNGGGGIFFVAANEAVQVELGIPEEQKTKLRAITDQYSSERIAARDEVGKVVEQERAKGNDETKVLKAELLKLEAKVNDSNDRFQKRLADAISADHLRRLRQITWQVYGSEILASDRELEKALDLQQPQLERIQSINDADRKSAMGRMLRGKTLLEIQKERDANAIDVLTESQRETYKRLIGKPFDLALLGPKRPNQTVRAERFDETYRRFAIGTNLGIFSLVRNLAVQKEIGLNDADVAKVAAVTEQFNRAWHEAGGRIRTRRAATAVGRMIRYAEAAIPPIDIDDDLEKSLEERAAEMAHKHEVWRVTTAKHLPQLKELLSDQQFARLQQINLQAMGVAAYRDDGIAQELSFSPDQMAKINDLVETYRIKGEDLVRRAVADAVDFRIARQKVVELTKSQEEETRKVLTAAQINKLEVMKGKSFELEQLQD